MSEDVPNQRASVGYVEPSEVYDGDSAAHCSFFLRACAEDEVPNQQEGKIILIYLMMCDNIKFFVMFYSPKYVACC